MTDNKSHSGSIMAGIAGLTAAAVGAYYLYGHKNAAKHRALVRGWMLKAKGEVLEELEKAQDVTESAYMGAVDTVARKYNQIKNIDPEELANFVNEMKDHWNGIRRTVRNRGKKPAKSTKSSASKTKKSRGRAK